MGDRARSVYFTPSSDPYFLAWVGAVNWANPHAHDWRRFYEFLRVLNRRAPNWVPRRGWIGKAEPGAFEKLFRRALQAEWPDAGAERLDWSMPSHLKAAEIGWEYEQSKRPTAAEQEANRLLLRSIEQERAERQRPGPG